MVEKSLTVKAFILRFWVAVGSMLIAASMIFASTFESTFDVKNGSEGSVTSAVLSVFCLLFLGVEGISFSCFEGANVVSSEGTSSPLKSTSSSVAERPEGSGSCRRTLDFLRVETNSFKLTMNCTCHSFD